MVMKAILLSYRVNRNTIFIFIDFLDQIEQLKEEGFICQNKCIILQWRTLFLPSD